MKIKNISLNNLITTSINNTMTKIFKKKELISLNDLELVTKKCINKSNEEIYFAFTYYNFHLKKFSLNTMIILNHNEENFLYQQNFSNLRMLSGEENLDIIKIYKSKILEICNDIENTTNIEDYLTNNNYLPIT